ncbi:MAG: protoglobin domain-containing protein [Isosphaeraceae bacterium]
MEHRQDHPGNRPPGPHPSEEIPPSEVLARRRAFLEISDADVERVRGLAGLFDSFLDGYVEQFHTHLVAHPATASFLTDAHLVARLKQAQKRYFESLFRARLDADYVVDRQRIGQIQADVGLEAPWFLDAYNQYLQYAFRKFAAHCRGDLGCYVEGTLALLKLLMLDIGLALDPYVARSTKHLRTALRLLAQSNAELKEFAHLASHDLKTPLATVANLCEEFLDEFGPQVPAEGRGLIEAARSKTLKLGRMIDELLEISEAGTQTNQRVPVAMRPLVDEVLERLRPEIEGRSIQISVPDHLPKVHAHPGRLREVFYHVLSNAVKFLDKEAGTIRLGVEAANGEHIFCISDNGPGIAEADLPQIFAPFRRLPQHRNKPGSGLGLYFVKTFVEEQGGRVWVESRVGEGTQFYIALPAEGAV